MAPRLVRQAVCMILGLTLFSIFYTLIIDMSQAIASTETKPKQRISLPTYSKPYPTQVHRPDEDVRRILLWTAWFDEEVWFFDKPGSSAFKNCPESRCEVTTDKSLLYESDMVMFHIRNLENGPEFLPPSHPEDQRWVYMMMESPTNTWLAVERNSGVSPNDLTPLDNMFNLTMTYLQESDIQINYGRYLPQSNPYPFISRDYAKGKDRLALWYVSNCFTEQSKMRTSFVEALGKHINIDVFGICGRPDPCEMEAGCVSELRTHYKFYLALENSLCKDYISEKLWNTYRSEMVPIVLGAPLADYLRVAPSDSFLHVDNFTSVEALAKYIHYLDQNDEAYNRYFKWKEKYAIAEGSKNAIYAAVCNLCEVAHNNLIPKKSYKISEWWNPERLCRTQFW